MFPIKVVYNTPKGRGVVATKDFHPGEIIEICPVLVMTPTEAANYDQTILGEYLYEWASEDDAAIILGYGFLYNHSYSPNAVYERDFTNQTMIYKAIKLIKAQEEILINYNGEPDNFDAIDWFEIK